MNLITLKLSDIKPYPNNPRQNDDAVDAVAESIRQCGYCAPIVVDEDRIVLAGHTRLKALKKLGWKQAEVVIKDGLTEEQKQKYRLLDNKTGEIAKWNMEMLTTELESVDFGNFNFGFELPTMMTDEYIQKYFDETGSESDKKDKSVLCPSCGCRFEP